RVGLAIWSKTNFHADADRAGSLVAAVHHEPRVAHQRLLGDQFLRVESLIELGLWQNDGLSIEKFGGPIVRRCRAIQQIADIRTERHAPPGIEAEFMLHIQIDLSNPWESAVALAAAVHNRERVADRDDPCARRAAGSEGLHTDARAVWKFNE